MAGKRLVVCLDGTWNRADDGKRSTNVVGMMRAIAPKAADGTPQVVFYAKGVGTGGPADRIMGGLTGAGLESNVKDAYIFLGNNHEPGDEIFIFGFSRGAYTARSLGGFLSACGLLDRWSLRHFDAAWAYYRTPPEARDPAKRPPGRDVGIECIGVWDTVGSLGVPTRWINPFASLKARHRFHDTSLSPKVRRAFHAIAVDEKRGPFAPTLWQQADDAAPPVDQVVEQVWFSGAHSDVGGGYGHSDGADAGLAPIALRWMVGRVRQTTRLEFRADWDIQHPAGDPLAAMHESRSLAYLVSRVLPYERVIGEQDAWTRSYLPSRNQPDAGHRFVGEAIHASVLARFGAKVGTIDGSKAHEARYEPASVAAAKGHVPIAFDMVAMREATPEPSTRRRKVVRAE